MYCFRINTHKKTLNLDCLRHHYAYILIRFISNLGNGPYVRPLPSLCVSLMLSRLVFSRSRSGRGRGNAIVPPCRSISQSRLLFFFVRLRGYLRLRLGRSRRSSPLPRVLYGLGRVVRQPSCKPCACCTWCTRCAAKLPISVKV